MENRLKVIESEIRIMYRILENAYTTSALIKEEETRKVIDQAIITLRHKLVTLESELDMLRLDKDSEQDDMMWSCI